MKFGTYVMVTRGGGGEPGTRGSKREVAGVLIGARGWQRRVRLLEDDSLDTVGWNRAGQVGWSSSVRAMTGGRLCYERMLDDE